MVINEVLKEGVDLIKELEYSNPLLEARLILAKVLDVDKNYIYLNGNEEVPIDRYNKFMKIIEERARAYPFQYLLGKQEFMGLDFQIEEGVLIPRPETEILVEYIIDNIKKESKKTYILDIGSGSGAISISLAKYCPNTFIYGIDIDRNAIKVGNINKERYNLSNVEFVQGNLFDSKEISDKKFHIIVSNPPYIKTENIANLQRDVRDFEPRKALDGGVDGLDFYRKISKKAKKYLLSDGILIYEIGYDQGKSVKEILISEGFSDITIEKDLQGHDRVLIGIWR